MQRVKVTLNYDDGTVEEVVLKPVSLVAAERHFKGSIPGMEGTLWAAHYQLRKEATFADWLESLEMAGDEALPPSSATLSEPSPSSP